ncbi:MAG: HAD-IIIC family phosphatase [Candidatus Bathyarchaeota archaeon]|nr:HAD-IIIC family phosphatase [Candidatus Bathyarchaeota archaeon]
MFIKDSKFRSRTLYMWGKTSDTETKSQTADYEQLKKGLDGKKLFFIGGCDLSFLKEYVQQNLTSKCLLTFEYGGSSNPLLEVKDEQSELWSFCPDVVILSHNMQIRNYIKELQLHPVTYQDQDVQLQEIKNTFSETIKALRQKEITGPIVLLTFPLVYRPTLGAFEYHSNTTGYSLIEFLAKLQLIVYDVAKTFDDVFVLNIDRVFANEGNTQMLRRFDAIGWYDHPTRKGAKCLGDALLQILQVYYKIGKKIKCIAVDLDNTLWAGIIRDDGVAGITLFANRARYLQMLQRRGIILTIVSKNDPNIEPLVDEVLGEFGKIFTLKKISWNNKVDSLQEIATELNIGLDSIAFFDDDPFNLDQVRHILPGVSTYSPDELLDALHLPEFDPGVITDESRKRGLMYQQQKIRKDEETGFQGSKEDFLKSIDMKLWIREAAERDLSRVTDLIGRTNQLNATITRFQKPEIINFHKSKAHKIYVVNVWDKYGEYGLSGVAIIEENDGGNEWVLISFLFSCRVMGKTIEQNTLAFIQREAKKVGVKRLVGQYKKTDRNATMKRIFEEAKFHEKNSDDDFQEWIFDLDAQQIPDFSEWVKLLKSAP